jgi:RING finger protein 113A
MALFKSRNVAKQSVATKRKTVVGESSKDAWSSSDESDSETRSGAAKKARLLSHTTVKHKPTEVDTGDVSFDHSHSSTVTNTNDATKQTILFREEPKASTPAQDELTVPDGIYRGKANYAKYVQPRESISSKARFGPIKLSATNIRSTTVIDYQPDVCKDYKQTGFCGYGDSCKFLHSREDYKAGWKLDKEWEEFQGLKSTKKSKKDDAKERTPEIPDIPFKCVICKDDYKEPVVTPCEHYFCEACFFKEHRTNPGCFICGKSTGSVAKPAKDLMKLLKARTTNES